MLPMSKQIRLAWSCLPKAAAKGAHGHTHPAHSQALAPDFVCEFRDYKQVVLTPTY